MLPHEKEHERQAFKKMPLKKKLEHFLSYYLLQTVIVVAVIAVVLFMIWNAFIKKRDTIIFSAVVFDDIFDYEGLTAMTENLRVFYGVTDPHDIVRIDNNYRSRSTDDRLRLSVVTSAKECDVIVADDPFFRELAGYGYFIDLGEVMTEKEASAFSDRLVKTPGRLETEELIPSDGSGQGAALSYGISLENCEKWQSLKGTMEHPVAGIVANTERVGTSLGFFSWVLDKTDNIYITQEKENTGNADNTENTGNTDNTEDTGNTDNTENTDSTENTVNADKTDNIDNTDKTS